MYMYCEEVKIFSENMHLREQAKQHESKQLPKQQLAVLELTCHKGVI